MNKRKNLIIIMMYAVVMLFALTACGEEKEDTDEREKVVSEVEVGGDEIAPEVDSTSQEEKESEEESDYFSMKLDGVYSFTDGTLVTGTIESGTVHVGDQVEAVKDGTPVLGTVIEIDIVGELVEEATVGEYIGLKVENIRRSDVEEGMYVTTPSQETLDQLAAQEEENASVLHPQVNEGADSVWYDINIERGEYIETTFCTIEDFEIIIGSEFGNNKITIEEPQYDSSMLAGFKAKLTNTSEQSYNPSNGVADVWSYCIDSYTPGGPYEGTIYVNKDGDLLDTVEVAPGETVEVYVLGELDYGWHEKYADIVYVTFGMQDNFAETDINGIDALDFSFEISEIDR